MKLILSGVFVLLLLFAGCTQNNGNKNDSTSMSGNEKLCADQGGTF